MKELIIKEEVLNTMLNYMAGKPYIEVKELIETVLNTVKPLEAPEPTE